MKVVIIGAGKLGYYTAKTLKEHGHSVVVVDVDRDLCHRISTQLDMKVFCDDGTTVEALNSADAANCDAVVALTGKDEYNIVICELAKFRFHVKKTIARASNPKNADKMKLLGADIVVSSTQMITNYIDMEVDAESISVVASFNGGEAAAIELTIPEGGTFGNTPISSLDLPRGCVIASAYRNGEMIIPRGDTVLLPGDRINAFVTKNELNRMKTVFGINKIIKKSIES